MNYPQMFNDLSNKLRNSGIYDNDSESVVYALLYSFSEALGRILDELNLVYREMFVQTARTDGLSEYMNLVSVIFPDDSIAGKRKSIITALSFNNENGADMIRSNFSDLYNIDADVSEGSGSVIVTVNQNLTSEQENLIREHMSSMMPVTTTLDFRT